MGTPGTELVPIWGHSVACGNFIYHAMTKAPDDSVLRLDPPGMQTDNWQDLGFSSEAELLLLSQVFALKIFE